MRSLNFKFKAHPDHPHHPTGLFYQLNDIGITVDTQTDFKCRTDDVCPIN